MSNLNPTNPNPSIYDYCNAIALSAKGDFSKVHPLILAAHFQNLLAYYKHVVETERESQINKIVEMDKLVDDLFGDNAFGFENST